MMQGPFKSILVESMQGLSLLVLPVFFVCTEEEQTDKANDANKTNATMRRPVHEEVFVFCIDGCYVIIIVQQIENSPMMPKGIDHALFLTRPVLPSENTVPFGLTIVAIGYIVTPTHRCE